MKIGVLYIGIVRPDRGTFLDHKENLLNSLGKENEVETFLFSWKYPTSLEVQQNKDVNFSILEDEILYDKYIESVMGVPPDDFTTRRRNHYKMYIHSKKCIDYVNSLKKDYDFLVYSRPDLRVVFNAEQGGWYDKENFNIPSNGMNPEAYGHSTHDQFHIATPDIMSKVWDYKSLGYLMSKLPMDPSIYPESTLFQLMRESEINQKPREMEYCALNRSLDIFRSY